MTTQPTTEEQAMPTTTDAPPEGDAPPTVEPTPERPPVEVVDAPPGKAVEKAGGDSATAAALDRATEAALAFPGNPTGSEFLTLAATARLITLSSGAPKAVRNNPHLAFHMAMVGRDLGLSVTASVALIDVIGEGDDATLSLSPELLNGQVRRLGLGSIVPIARTASRAVAVALAPGGSIDNRCRAHLPDEHWPTSAMLEANPELASSSCRCVGVLGGTEFTWDDAVTAGLAMPDCKPTEHTPKCLAYNSKGWERCRQGYRTYPKRMMWWRAAGYCSADYFPEAGLGLYSPEELGAVVDAEGRPIDPSTVELPAGYEPALPPPSPQDDLLAEAQEGSDLAARRDDLVRRLTAIKAVPVAEADLKAQWQEPYGDAPDTPKSPPFPYLRRRHLGRVVALVASTESKIRTGKYGADEQAAWEAAKAQAEEVATPPVHDELREALLEQEAVEAGGADERPPGSAPPLVAASREKGPDLVLASECAGCHERFRTGSGPKGRHPEHPDYHRDCAPM